MMKLYDGMILKERTVQYGHMYRLVYIAEFSPLAIGV